ncbi:hypothetical protein Salat_0952300 [Sesamum alatum]|uniref:Uncharacterized protein n=1 Tax=Sesamum alatum TaxID=300844 RepID=A0AAE1YKW2_9LAMI|nr:hypothetical protein Salat_0952300 [Sesamum alatum]
MSMQKRDTCGFSRIVREAEFGLLRRRWLWWEAAEEGGGLYLKKINGCVFWLSFELGWFQDSIFSSGLSFSVPLLLHWRLTAATAVPEAAAAGCGCDIGGTAQSVHFVT